MTFIDAWLFWLLSLGVPGALDVETPRGTDVQQVRRTAAEHQHAGAGLVDHITILSSESHEITGRGELTVASQISNGY